LVRNPTAILRFPAFFIAICIDYWLFWIYLMRRMSRRRRRRRRCQIFFNMENLKLNYSNETDRYQKHHDVACLEGQKEKKVEEIVDFLRTQINTPL